MNEEYLELVENAHEALRRLLMHTEPGTGGRLHDACSQLRDLRLRENERRAGAAFVEEPDAWREWRERRSRWKALPKPERLHRVLNALANDRLTIRELWHRLEAENPDCRMHESDVRPLVKALHDRGDLDRVGEPRAPRGAAIRYRYFRPALDPRLAALEI